VRHFHRDRREPGSVREPIERRVISMSLSRQQRRAKLKENVQAVTRNGIDLDDSPAGQLWSQVGLTRILIDILGGRAPSRASDAARRAHEFFELSLARNPSNHRIECAKGCAFCCHMRVTALAPEIFYAAGFVRKQFGATLEDVLGRIRATDSGARSLGARERPLRKIPCGLLLDNACSIYTARPSACRGLTSISVRTCERGFNGEDVNVQTPAVWTEIRRAHNQAMWAALVASGLPAHSYELNHAMRIALETPDAETRWLSGEDIFAEVDRDALLGGADKERKQKLIDLLVAAALGKELPA
jgi:hypothetical protein